MGSLYPGGARNRPPLRRRGAATSAPARCRAISYTSDLTTTTFFIESRLGLSYKRECRGLTGSWRFTDGSRTAVGSRLRTAGSRGGDSGGRDPAPRHHQKAWCCGRSWPVRSDRGGQASRDPHGIRRRYRGSLRRRQRPRESRWCALPGNNPRFLQEADAVAGQARPSNRFRAQTRRCLFLARNWGRASGPVPPTRWGMANARRTPHWGRRRVGGDDVLRRRSVVQLEHLA